jgi:transcriptional/translational regulatory protein YebC/TACO1
MRPLLKHDSEVRNHHRKTLYCLVKGDHVYTLNNNLKELQQKAEEDRMILKASESYFIKEDQTVPIFRMIDGIDDIIKIVKEVENSKETVEI